MPGHVKIGSRWEEVQRVWTKRGSTWEQVDTGTAKVSGSWEQWHPTVATDFLILDLLSATDALTLQNNQYHIDRYNSASGTWTRRFSLTAVSSGAQAVAIGRQLAVPNFAYWTPNPIMVVWRNPPISGRPQPPTIELYDPDTYALEGTIRTLGALIGSSVVVPQDHITQW